MKKIGREVKKIGREVKKIGREVRKIGREVENIGREVKNVGRELKKLEEKWPLWAIVDMCVMCYDDSHYFHKQRASYPQNISK